MGNSTSKSQKNDSKKQFEIKKYVEEIEDFEAESSPVLDDDVDGNVQDDLSSAASDPNPEKLLAAFQSSVCLPDPTDLAALSINPKLLQYPFENLIFEGGGNKGVAYAGVFKCLEDLQITRQIKRVGGASAGALAAGMLSLGYTADEMYIVLADVEEMVIDHSCGYLSLLPNLLTKFGWNSGEKVYNWFGVLIERKTGNPDTTFHELYKLRGIELCVVVTNLNLKKAQYFHPKTSPDMPIRNALRMSMSIPGLFSPIRYDNHGQTDFFVDGGLLVNFPINCFDGWFLSMEKEDSFLHKLTSLKDVPKIMSSLGRFKATKENKTIGFLLYDDAEPELMRFELESRIGSLLPKKPKVKTDLFRKNEKKKKMMQKAEREHSQVVNAVESFLQVLNKHNIDEDEEFITRDELTAALNDEGFSIEQQHILFGKEYHRDKVFEILDRDGNGQIAFYELLQFMEERGIRMQNRVQGYGRHDINTFVSFLIALQETMLTNLTFFCLNETDKDRTVGINTGHVGTTDYNLAEEDMQFVVQRGYNATMSFLRYYAAQNPTLVKERPPQENGNATLSEDAKTVEE